MTDTKDEKLTVPRAHEVLTGELGFPWSKRQVTRMADEKRLPFFKGPNDKERLIARSVLEDCVLGRQTEALENWLKRIRI